jgi:predicted GIY-YIG superfamily endonuclease/alkylated DNA nucleotide flippase Atl1
MPFHVYILECIDGSFYTGYTKNIEMRTRLHVIGKGARYTRTHKPQRVAYVEIFETQAKAMKREKQIKKMTHEQKLHLASSQEPPKSRHNRDFQRKPDKVTCSLRNSKPMPTKKPSWCERLNDNKGLPKVEEITPKMSKKWGTGTIVIPAPIEVDEIMRQVPLGRVTSINEIRSALAKKHKATIGCPMTTGIFAWIAANASEERKKRGEENVTPYWRTLKTGGLLNEKYPGGIEAQRILLEQEGHTVEKKGKKCKVIDYEKFLVTF